MLIIEVREQHKNNVAYLFFNALNKDFCSNSTYPTNKNNKAYFIFKPIKRQLRQTKKIIETAILFTEMLYFISILNFYRTLQ